MTCISCARGYYEECGHEPPTPPPSLIIKEHVCNENCVCPIHKTPLLYAKSTDEHACQDINCKYAHGLEKELAKAPPVGRPKKDDSEIGISAGRKRAADEHSIDSEADCEWRWRANCGGGLNPIVGCIQGKQRDRHHGPIKNTSHNERQNIHKICPHCHHTWHAKNDPVYDEDLYATLPHRPRPATPEELLGASDV